MVPSPAAPRRLAAVARHMSSSSSPQPPNDASTSSDDVLHEAQDGIRFITLNRPKALNALNASMIRKLKDLLQRYHASEDNAAIVLQGEGRAFCAGGDVVALVKDASAGRPEIGVDFFREEYEVDNLLARMKKPVVAVLDGIVMGGGVGLSVHLPFRIVTEKTVFSMPETTIGLFPDVGAAFFLSRMDGMLGRYLGLTSERLEGYAAYHAGIGTHFIPSANLDDVRRRLIEVSNSGALSHDAIDDLLEEYAADYTFLNDAAKRQPPIVGAKRRAIDYCFRHKDAEKIVADLRKLETKKLDEPSIKDAGLEEWAKGVADTIEMRSPTSVKVALQSIRNARAQTIDEVFQSDMRLAATFCYPDVAPDFVTGVTHLLIKKQRDSRADWKPATLSEVTSALLKERFFGSSPAPGVHVPTLAKLPNDSKALFGDTKAYQESGRGLPSEVAINDAVSSSKWGSFAPKEEDVLKTLQRQYKRASGKVGLKEKVLETLRRMCSYQGENGDELSWTDDSKPE